MKAQQRPQFTMSSATIMVTLAAVIASMPTSALAQSAFARAHREKAQSADRYGDLPLGAVIRTDDRYGHDGLLRGPRGWVYWNLLENPKPYQNPNLWTDKHSTYLFGQFEMPAGSSLTIRGRFPYARYFKLALYRFERNTFVALGDEALAGYDIQPDAGSNNPFGVGAERLAKNRDFTLQILAQETPKKGADRVKNTLYVGRDEKPIQALFRIYLADKGYDGAGWGPGDVPSLEGPGFTYEAKLADGTRLSAAEVVKRFARPLPATPPLMSVDAWYKLVNAKDNDARLKPDTSPARADSRWENFYGLQYAVAGAFKTPEARAKIKRQTEMEGGGDPTTSYMLTYISRKFGPVYVIRAKLPTFPNTYAGARIMPDAQLKYWSVVSVATAPSGELWDGLTDFQVPLDEQGHYTIVVSRPEDRPKNATLENGVAWMDWGPGEGLDDPRDRKDWGMLLMRFMTCSPYWENSPAKATKPGTEEVVMGPYYPRGEYTTKERFEADGLKKRALVATASFKNVRGRRYGEIFLVGDKGIQIYNSTGLSECPPEQWDALDTRKLAAQFQVKDVMKNGPHWWLFDEGTLEVGEQLSFGGMGFRYGATVPAYLVSDGKFKEVFYKVFQSTKKGINVYSRGKQVYELVSPEGQLFLMHSSNMEVKELATLGKRLKLPEGWQYRVRTLDQDFTLRLEGITHVVSDNFRNVYNLVSK